MVYVKLVICMVYMKHHPNGSLKNIMAFSAVANLHAASIFLMAN